MSWRPVNQPARDSTSIFSEKKSSLQLYIESQTDNVRAIVGLEYVVEVHSSEPGGKTVYHCVLCGETIEGMVKMVQHLHKLSHKLHYLEHFTLIKEQRLENNITQKSVDQVVEKVEAYFGRMTVKLVIGGNTYAANEKFIIDTIKSGRHFNEDSKFLSFLYNELQFEPKDLERTAGRRRRRSSSSDDSREKSRRRSKKKKRKERRRSRDRSVSSDSSSKSRSKRREASSLSSDPPRRRRRRSDLTGERRQRSQTTRDEDDVIVLESPSPSPSPVPVPASSNHQMQLEKEEKQEEEEALRCLAAEKSFFTKHPNRHPKYSEMWSDFWIKKNEELKAGGVDISTVDITVEWRMVFDKFIRAENKEKVEAKKSELALKRRQGSRCEIILLSDTESPPSPPSPPRISQDHRLSDHRLSDHRTSDHRLSDHRTSDHRLSDHRRREEEEVKVLTLLNFLSQLSSKHLLSAMLRDKVTQIRETAFSMEADVYGSSQLLLHNSDCFNLMDQAGEALKLKQKERKVGELDLSVVNITLGQIAVFLRTSSCQKSDILEIETISPVEKDNSRVLKISISRTIEGELKKSGKVVSKQELDYLVEREYARVQHKIPNTASNIRNINLQSSSTTSTSTSSTSDQSNLFSAYSERPESFSSSSSSIDWTNVMKGVNNIQNSRDPRAQPKPAVRRSPPRPPSQSSDNLTDGELAALMANFDQLSQEEKTKLIACMGDLEAVDPRKVERIKRIMFQNK